jgi:branched-chain amino acid transport system ATP-binding protein
VPLLEVRDVAVRFGGHLAVNEASLTVEAGAIAGLIGPNGAGKTTLFNVICGMQEPVRGKVVLDGHDVTDHATHARARRGMARTFQRLELFGSLTARDNLLVAGELRNGARGAADVLADEVIGRCGLGEFAERRADQLTTGQARLVELARALMIRPRLLLLDEPASGLDADETDRFAELLLALAGDGLGILLVEHDVPLVMRVCSSIVVLDYGRVIASGPPEQVRNDPAVIQAYLGVATGDGHG